MGQAATGRAEATRDYAVSSRNRIWNSQFKRTWCEKSVAYRVAINRMWLKIALHKLPVYREGAYTFLHDSSKLPLLKSCVFQIYDKIE